MGNLTSSMKGELKDFKFRDLSNKIHEAHTLIDGALLKFEDFDLFELPKVMKELAGNKKNLANKIQEIGSLVTSSLSQLDDEHHLLDLACEVLGLKQTHTSKNDYINKIINCMIGEDHPLDPIVDKLNHQLILVMLKDIEHNLRNKGIDLSSDKAVYEFNAALQFKLHAHEEELKPLLKCSNITINDLYSQHRRLSSDEIEKESQKTSNSAEEYEANANAARFGAQFPGAGG